MTTVTPADSTKTPDPLEMIEKTVQMDQGMEEAERKLAAAHEVFPWKLLETVLTGALLNDDEPEHASHKRLMVKFVLGLSDSKSAYYRKYHDQGASAYANHMKKAADEILRFYRKYNSGDPQKKVYRFLLTVSDDVVYRIIIDTSSDVPTFQSEPIEA
jgi:hypothetical protein